jgi:hypothetical protein
MIATTVRSYLDDPIRGETELITPAENVLARWPALPPGREGRIGGKAQHREQLFKKPIKIGISRLRVLLLIYRFT